MSEFACCLFVQDVLPCWHVWSALFAVQATMLEAIRGRMSLKPPAFERIRTNVYATPIKRSHVSACSCNPTGEPCDEVRSNGRVRECVRVKERQRWGELCRQLPSRSPHLFFSPWSCWFIFPVVFEPHRQLRVRSKDMSVWVKVPQPTLPEAPIPETHSIFDFVKVSLCTCVCVHSSLSVSSSSSSSSSSSPPPPPPLPPLLPLLCFVRPMA